MNIPGYGEICDQDAGMIFISLLIFVPTCFIFLIRNFIKISKNKGNKNRKTALIIFISLLILSFGGLNQLIFATWFGKLKYQARSSQNKMVYIKLYENGKFYSEGFYTSCYEEITGTYKIKNDNLKLEYGKESEFISKEYLIKGKELINSNDKKDTLLIE
ncbi:hypothetical protein [Formosa algae]|uniref:hypothetical protein n=1 Tax=Formosa algae TaxID=225843 RepID=UPI000CCE9BED|nr:hypothetical protein [Formosa algae]PNW25681.1 hypothetical protein BKP44_19345 [Formosa algae]